MCSISESKPTKKRKAPDHLDNPEPGEQSDDARRDEAGSSKKQHLMASVASVPTTDSLSNLLVQGLQSMDDKLINDVVNKKESVIESTINNLPNAYVEPLFNFLQKALYEHGENVNYVVCLRKLFQAKISQVLNIPNIRNNLKMLSDTLDLRCDLLDKCYKLKGRLDLMFLMLDKDEKAIREENIVIYEESSSEEDADEPEDGEELIGLMNSDDEGDLADEPMHEEESEQENGVENDQQSDDDDLVDDEEDE